MNVKNFMVAGFVGGIVNYLLGWLFWGILFKDTFPSDESQMNMLFIFLGCITFGFFVSYVFNKWASIATAITGSTAGAIFALFLSLHSNFFQHSMELSPDYMMMATDILLSVVCGAAVGAVVGFVNGKMK
jgi:membrane protein YqaA with SNARE-associated domain